MGGDKVRSPKCRDVSTIYKLIILSRSKKIMLKKQEPLRKFEGLFNLHTNQDIIFLRIRDKCHD